jgi:phosphatidylethanolamine/phosphatidyl-N-methylethanolamine N-methyltransferase
MTPTAPNPNDGPDYWTRHSKRLDRVTHLLNRHVDDVAQTVADDLRGCSRVLELGAGTGLVTLALAPVVDELVATDLAPGMREILRQRLDEAGHSEVPVETEDATAIQSPDESFDGVVAANLVHLLPDPGAALREMRRVLRPGGRLAVPTFAHAETWRVRLLSRLARLGGFPIVTRFGGSTLAQSTAAAGFFVLRNDLVPGLFPIRYVLAERVEDETD